MYRKCAYYVNKLRQNVGLETGLWVKLWRHNSAHQTQMTTLRHWMKRPMKIFCVRHWSSVAPDTLLVKQDFQYVYTSRHRDITQLSEECYVILTKI